MSPWGGGVSNSVIYFMKCSCLYIITTKHMKTFTKVAIYEVLRCISNLLPENKFYKALSLS